VDQNRFGALTRLMTTGPSRREVMRGLAGAGLGLGILRLPGLAKAKKKHKKAPQPVLNEFGCLDVGQPCRGNSALCCSGVSKGKKPKKGKPDKRVCAAHHTGNCTPQRAICEVEAPVLSLCDLPSDTSHCVHTTGNAVFCGSLLGFTESIHCRACAKDSDCLAFGFAPGSACAILAGSVCDEGAVCASTEGRACVPPAGPA
jgi:hypothetical protein